MLLEEQLFLRGDFTRYTEHITRCLIQIRVILVEKLRCLAA